MRPHYYFVPVKLSFLRVRKGNQVLRDSLLGYSLTYVVTFRGKKPNVKKKRKRTRHTEKGSSSFHPSSTFLRRNSRILVRGATPLRPVPPFEPTLDDWSENTTAQRKKNGNCRSSATNPLHSWISESFLSCEESAVALKIRYSQPKVPAVECHAPVKGAASDRVLLVLLLPHQKN
jgi:hypothetical protein